MKHIIILGDGMADQPIERLGGKTPLQYAATPAMDSIAARGISGTLCSVPEGFAPGSEIANLGILGYDVAQVYEGRGSLEAASMGIEIEPEEMAMRLNLICVEDGRIKNHSAGHISTAEAAELICTLQKELGNYDISFHPGVSYRHLLKIKGADKHISCTPPHDVPGEKYVNVLPVAQTPEAEKSAAMLRDLISRSAAILENHPINVRRIERGLDPANLIWPWSPGYRPSMQTLSELYGICSGSVISAVDLIKGIGIYAGLKSIAVEGATGLYNTNYEGKMQAAVDALKSGDDFVFLHVEASDEAGHEGDIDLKIKTIENLDNRIVAPLLESLKTMNEDVAIAVLPDHPTPCCLRTHTSDPVPFTIYRSGIKADNAKVFDEFTAASTGLHLDSPTDFIKLFLSNE